MSIDSPVTHSPERQSIRARTIEPQLGAASERFFGEGFTRVRHDVRPTNVGSERAEFLIIAHYPDDWSRKGDENQHAHFASADAMVLAARMAEHYLQSAGMEVANCWISHCTLDPGKEAVDVSGPLSAYLEGRQASTVRWYGPLFSMSVAVLPRANDGPDDNSQA